MDPATPENAPFFTALFRHMQMCSMLGCPSVAAEVGKLLLSLDPQGDRFNVLLTLDHFLVTAAKHTQLLDFMGLTLTPGNSLPLSPPPLPRALLFLLLLVVASSLLHSLPFLFFYALPCPAPCTAALFSICLSQRHLLLLLHRASLPLALRCSLFVSLHFLISYCLMIMYRRKKREKRRRGRERLQCRGRGRDK